MIKPFYSDNDYIRVNPVDDTGDESNYRTPFWRDRSRLMHSPSFRRLRGKTQLFPVAHSDFFRCRLTHSLEVANIGKTITRRLNWQIENKIREKLKEKDPDYIIKALSKGDHLINTDLIEFACLAHDLGHPPFGHQGEEILNTKMADYGGFEGNAQTFRILTLLEKKKLIDIKNDDDFNFLNFEEGKLIDRRRGLNLTFRALASIIKYNRCIPAKLTEKKNEGAFCIKKGIYEHDKEILQRIRNSIGIDEEELTLEAQIMDLADDIAYSTYDLEDAFKGGFLHPLKLHALSNEFMERVVDAVNEIPEIKNKEIQPCSKEDIRRTIMQYASLDNDPNTSAAQQLRISEKFSANGYRRSTFASEAISDFVSNIDIDYNHDAPNSSKVFFRDQKTRLRIEILKKITYLSQIESSRLKIVEHRGQKLVGELFDVLSNRNKNIDGQFLIPDIRSSYLVILKKIEEYEHIRETEYKVLNEFKDGFLEGPKSTAILLFTYSLKMRTVHVEYSDEKVADLLKDLEIDDDSIVTSVKNLRNVERSIWVLESHRLRMICDFISSMTDRYAVDYLDRLTSIHSTRSIFSYI